MKLAIMQPYFFPYLGYFDLINYSNKFIVFDTVQYIKGGWINRNRVLHNNSGWKYINVPHYRARHDAKIMDVTFENSSLWQNQVLKKILFYRNMAPYFENTYTLIEECLNFSGESLSRLNVNCLSKVCTYLDIRLDYQYYSEMDIDIGLIDHAGEWGLKISEALGAKQYINLPGGKAIFSAEQFSKGGVNLILRAPPVFQYKTNGLKYEPNLSIIDVMMWNSPEEIKCYLDSVKSTKFNMKENEISN